MREDHHLQREADDVRDEHRQVLAGAQAGQLENLGEVAGIDPMPPPHRPDARKAAGPAQPRRGEKRPQHVGHH